MNNTISLGEFNLQVDLSVSKSILLNSSSAVFRVLSKLRPVYVKVTNDTHVFDLVLSSSPVVDNVHLSPPLANLDHCIIHFDLDEI